MTLYVLCSQILISGSLYECEEMSGEDMEELVHEHGEKCTAKDRHIDLQQTVHEELFSDEEKRIWEPVSFSKIRDSFSM